MTANENTFTDWRLLLRIGAFAAWFTTLLIPIAVISHLLWPPPTWAAGTAAEWFTYIQNNPLAGMLNLDFAMEIGLVFSIPLYLSLYFTLKQSGPSLSVIAISIALGGVFLHLISNTAWEMLQLSNAHSIATTDLQRSVYLAAGEARLSVYYGMVFQVSYILGYLAYILIGILMLRGNLFNKTIAILAILTGIGGFGFYLPKIGTLFSVLVVFLIGIWNVLVGWRLFQLSKLRIV